MAVSVGFTANKMALDQILQVLWFIPANHSTNVLYSSIASLEVYDRCDLPAYYHNLHSQGSLPGPSIRLDSVTAKYWRLTHGSLTVQFILVLTEKWCDHYKWQTERDVELVM
jgi:hypothetical protein